MPKKKGSDHKYDPFKDDPFFQSHSDRFNDETSG